jgi:translocation and assembly module TamB
MHTMGLFKRTSISGASVAANRSKWKRRLLAASALLLFLLALSPRLIAHTPLCNWLLARAVKQLQGDIRIGSASLGWFGPPRFTDIEVRDNGGRLLLRIPRLEGSKSLAALVCHPFELGEFRLTQPTVHIVCSRDSSNLETVLAYWLKKKDVPSDFGFALDGVAVRIAVVQASVVLEDEDNGRKWSLDPLDMSVSIPRDRRTPLRLEVNASAAALPSSPAAAGGEKKGGGRLSADVSVHFVESAAAAPRLRAEGELIAGELPLDAAVPFLRRLRPQLNLTGRLSANLKLHPNDGQSGSPDLRLEGSVSLEKLALRGALLGPDILHLERVEAPLRIALDGSRLSIERLEIQSEVGKISLAGTMDLAKQLRDALLQPGHRIEAELNLARLADLTPNALHLSKETRLQSGALSLHLSSELRGESLFWQGDLHTSDLQGLYQGQRITWKEPFAVVLTAHQEMNDPLPVFERVRCDSDFLRLEMSGSPEEWTARGSFNLGRLCEHLAGFVEMGSLRVQGQGTLRAAARRNMRGGYRLESDVGFSQFSLSDGGRAWREDSLTIHLDLIGDRAGGYRVNAGALHLLSGKDGIDLDLLEPIADLTSLHSARARLRLHGSLTRWQDRVASLTGLLAGVRLAGQIDVDGRLRYEADTIQLEDVKIAGRAVQFQGCGVHVDEPTLDFTTSGRWLPERDTLELQHTRLSCPTITLQAPAVTLSSDPVGAWQITAGATVQGDLARLVNIPCSRGCLIGGALAGRVDLRPDEGRQVVQLDVNVQDLVLGSPATPIWRESRVNVAGHGVYDLVKDSLRIVQLHLDSPALNCDAAGQLNALSSDMELSLEGKLGYDLEKMGPQLRPYLGQGVSLSGRDVRPFHIAASKDNRSGGWLRLGPIEAALNQGRLRLEPSLRLNPLPLEAMLSKGRAIERAHLTPAVCAGALGYAVPVLAGAAQADGEFSLGLHDSRLPLMEPEKGDVMGWITLHSARISTSPLVQELSVLLAGPATPTLAQEAVVPFRMVNGRVYHTGLELRFPELTMRLSGSVGLDGSLSLTAEMPVPPKWLGSGRPAKSAPANPIIRLPIGGTLSQPRIDERALREASAPFVRSPAENTLRQETDGKAKKESESGLRKFFRRK